MGTKASATPGDHNMDNVIDFFTGNTFASLNDLKIVRLSPELDGLEMLYTNDASEDKYFSLKILCWALRANGDVVGLVPWLGDIIACQDINDPLNGTFQGYYDPGIDEVFFEPPIHKVVELETAAEYYATDSKDPNAILQEVPDTLGTHAVLTSTEKQDVLILQEVVSWRLHNDGSILGMIIDTEKVEHTPVLPGDECLFPAQSDDGFRYFFQHHIANKIKSKDPETMEAISLLSEEE